MAERYLSEQKSESNPGTPVAPEVTVTAPWMVQGEAFYINRWDTDKLGQRVSFAIKAGWVNKQGQLTKLGEKIAYSKWVDLSPAAQNVLRPLLDKYYGKVAPPKAERSNPGVMPSIEKVVARKLKTDEIIVVAPQDIEIRQTPLGSEAWYKGQRVTKPASRAKVLERIHKLEEIAKEANTTPEELYGVAYRRAREELAQLATSKANPGMSSSPGKEPTAAEVTIDNVWQEINRLFPEIQGKIKNIKSVIGEENIGFNFSTQTLLLDLNRPDWQNQIQHEAGHILTRRDYYSPLMTDWRKLRETQGIFYRKPEVWLEDFAEQYNKLKAGKEITAIERQFIERQFQTIVIPKTETIAPEVTPGQYAKIIFPAVGGKQQTRLVKFIQEKGSRRSYWAVNKEGERLDELIIADKTDIVREIPMRMNLKYGELEIIPKAEVSMHHSQGGKMTEQDKQVAYAHYRKFYPELTEEQFKRLFDEAWAKLKGKLDAISFTHLAVQMYPKELEGTMKEKEGKEKLLKLKESIEEFGKEYEESDKDLDEIFSEFGNVEDALRNIGIKIGTLRGTHPDFEPVEGAFNNYVGVIEPTTGKLKIRLRKNRAVEFKEL